MCLVLQFRFRVGIGKISTIRDLSKSCLQLRSEIEKKEKEIDRYRQQTDWQAGRGEVEKQKRERGGETFRLKETA